MANDLRITVAATLNANATLGNINQALKKLEKHPSLKALDVKLNVNSANLGNISAQVNTIASTLTSLSANIAKLVSDFEKLAASIKDSSDQAVTLGSMLKEAWSNTPDWMMEHVQEMQTTLIASVPAFASVTKNADRLTAAAKRASTMSSMLGVNLTALKFAAIGARAAAIGLQAAFTLGLSLAIQGVIAGVTALINHFQKAAQKQKEYQKQQDAIRDSYSNHKAKIDELVATYSKLSAATNNGKAFADADQESQYKDTIQQLSELMPSLVESVDEKGNAHLKSADAIKQEIEYAQKLARLKENQDVLDAKDTFNDQAKQLNKDQKAVDKIKSKILMRGNIVYGGFGYSSYSTYSESELNELQTKLAEAEHKATESSNAIKDQIGNIASSILDLNGVQVDDHMKESLEQVTAALNVDGLSDDELDNKAHAIADFYETLNSLKNVQDMSQVPRLTQNLQELGKAIGLSQQQVTNLINSFGKAPEVVSKSSETTEDFGAKINQLSDSIDDTVQQLTALGSAYETLHNGENLSSDTLLGLIDQYPELAKYLAETNDLTFNKGELIKQVAEIERQAKIQETKDAIASVETKKTELENKQKLAMQYYSNMLNFDGGEFDNFVVGGGLSQEDREQYLARTQELDQLKAKLKVLEQPLTFNAPQKSSSSGSTKSLNLLDDTDARISQINRSAAERAEQNEQIKDRLSSLSDDKNYQAAIEKSTILIASQRKEIQLLTSANAQLNSERVKLDNSSKYNMSKWTDANGEQTLSYIEDYNRLAGNDEAQKALQDQFDQWQKLTKAIIDNKGTIDSVNASMSENIQNQKQLRLEATQAYLDKQNQTLNEYNDKLSIVEKTKALYAEGSDEYNAQLKAQNDLIQQKISFLQGEIQWANQRLAQGNLEKEQIAEINGFIQSYTEDLLDAQAAQQQLFSNYADKVIENYKKMLQQRRDLELDAQDHEIDLENERHDNRMKNLDDEMSKFESYINAQLQAMDRANAQEDYDSNLQKMLSERDKLQQQYNTLLRDNSFEAKAKRADLQQQIDAKDDEIKKAQQDRERETRKQTLQDQLEDRKDYIGKEKDAEDDYHKKQTDELNRQKEQIKQHYQALLENEQTYIAMKQNLMSQDAAVVTAQLAGIRSEYDSFFTYLDSQKERYGDYFGALNSNFHLDYGQLDDYPTANTSGSGSSASSNTGSGSSGSTPPLTVKEAWADYLNNKKLAEALANQIKTKKLSPDETEKLRQQIKALSAKNQYYRDNFYFADKSYAELTGQVMSADSGGMTPAWGSSGKFLLAHEKEIVLNRQDTSNLLKIVDVTRNIVNSVRNLDFGGLLSSFAKSSEPASSGTVIHGMQVTISGNFAQKDGADVFDSLVNGLRRKGVVLNS